MSYKQSPLAPSTWTAQIPHYQGAHLALLEIFKSLRSGGVLGLRHNIPMSLGEVQGLHGKTETDVGNHKNVVED